VLLRFAASDHPLTGEPVLDWNDPRTWAYIVFFGSLGLVGLWGLFSVRTAKRSAPDDSLLKG
jgi:hypothetical protein